MCTKYGKSCAGGSKSCRLAACHPPAVTSFRSPFSSATFPLASHIQADVVDVFVKRVLRIGARGGKNSVRQLWHYVTDSTATKMTALKIRAFEKTTK